MNKYEQYFNLGLVEEYRVLKQDEIQEYRKTPINLRQPNIINHPNDNSQFLEIIKTMPSEEIDELYKLLQFANEQGKTTVYHHLKNYFILMFYATIIIVIILLLTFLFSF